MLPSEWPIRAKLTTPSLANGHDLQCDFELPNQLPPDGSKFPGAKSTELSFKPRQRYRLDLLKMKTPPPSRTVFRTQLPSGCPEAQ